MKTAVQAIFKDEAPYLREWVEFHRLQGFQDFYLYNNGSTDDWQSAIGDLPYVTVTDWYGTAQQLPSIEHFIRWCRSLVYGYRWAALLDIDEYLYAPSGEPVTDVLSRYERLHCVKATWLMFGSSGLQTRPEGLTIENYTMRGVDDLRSDHFKSIINPYHVNRFTNPHYGKVQGGREAFADELRINHYWTRSDEEWEAKCKRGRSDTGGFHDEATLATKDSLFEVKDETIKTLWAEQLRKAL